jgi:hypothetical protein
VPDQHFDLVVHGDRNYRTYVRIATGFLPGMSTVPAVGPHARVKGRAGARGIGHTDHDRCVVDAPQALLRIGRWDIVMDRRLRRDRRTLNDRRAHGDGTGDPDPRRSAAPAPRTGSKAVGTDKPSRGGGIRPTGSASVADFGAADVQPPDDPRTTPEEMA